MRTQFSKIAFSAIFVLALTFTFSCSSGGGSGGIEYGSVADNNGKTYKTVKIGTQVWMAENLGYNVPGSRCYGEGGRVFVSYDKKTGKDTYGTLSNAEIQANCKKYGRLYTWAAAMGIDAKYNEEEWGGSDVKHQGICPSGWHIPSVDDWDELKNYIESENGCSVCAGKHLRTKSGWNDQYGISFNGLDTYGFSALPAGQGSWITIELDSDGNIVGEEGDEFGGVGYSGVWWSTSENLAQSAFGLYMDYDFNWDPSNKSRRYSVRCIKDN